MFKRIFTVFALSLALVACDSGSSNDDGAAGGRDDDRQEQQD